MQNNVIKISKTKYNSIIKFELNRFIIRGKSLKISNLSEAKPSGLAQNLVRLPFVKTIFIAENFIAIEKNSPEYEKKHESFLKTEIEKYLQSGKNVLTEEFKNRNRLIPVELYTEMTPNPGVLKFVANIKLSLQKLQFTYTDESVDAPLARALFNFSYVKRVNIENNHISITKGGTVSWPEITLELREFIRNYLMKGKPVVAND